MKPTGGTAGINEFYTTNHQTRDRYIWSFSKSKAHVSCQQGKKPKMST